MKRLLVWLDRIMKKRKELKRWQRVVTVLAAVITFATTYALILPAITVERDNTEEVAGMYLEQGDAQEAMWEENALEPVDVSIADETDAEIPDHVDSQENLAGSSEDDGEETAPFVKTLKADGYDYTVTLTYDETSGIPEEADLTVSEIPQGTEEYQTYLAETKKAMGLSEEETLPSFAARFFDIKIMVGNQEFTPESGVSVEIRYAEPLAENPDTEVSAVHFADETAEAEVIEANTSEVQYDGTSTVEFTAESFSVYGVIYTVDFHWEVNGKTYEYSLSGGDSISFRDLVSIFGITDTEVDEFISGIDRITFSDESLVQVARVEEDIKAEELKKQLGIECEYSAELTKKQIAEIDAKQFMAPDWALIGLRPFMTTEVLCVTMKNGEQFDISVTDDQVRKTVISDSGDTYEVTVTYGADAEIPKGAELQVREISQGSDEYAELLKKADDALQGSGAGELYAHKAQFFDIKIVDGAMEIEPKAEVLVSLTKKGESTGPIAEYSDGNQITPTEKIVHYDLNQPSVLDITDCQDTDAGVEVVFKTDSFSDYGSIQAGYMCIIQPGDTVTLNSVYEGGSWAVTENMPAGGNFVTLVASQDGKSAVATAGSAYGISTITHTYINPETEKTETETFKVRVADKPGTTPPTITTVTNSEANIVRMRLIDFDSTRFLDAEQNTGSSGPYNTYNTGINRNHDFKFLGWGAQADYHYNLMNQYVGQDSDSNEHKPRQGIVDSHLDGIYPKLALGSKESLSYIFNDTDINTANGYDKKTFENAEGLFKYENGYYIYDSYTNYTYYDQASGSFSVYDRTYYQQASGRKALGFFPFNPATDAYYSATTGGRWWNNEKYSGENNGFINDFSANRPGTNTPYLPDTFYLNPQRGKGNHYNGYNGTNGSDKPGYWNHHLGINMAVDFNIRKDGKNVDGDPSIFEFNGDDDMWVFVDGKLVLDIGGLHQPIDGTINFTTGECFIQTDKNGTMTPQTNIYTLFDRQDFIDLDKPHRLEIFYLERGGCDSNCKISFNLKKEPPKYGTIHFPKMAPNRTPVPGATFQLFYDQGCTQPLRRTVQTEEAIRAGFDIGDYDYVREDVTATSDENGMVRFPKVLTGTYYMKEVSVPEGYWASEDVYQVVVDEDPRVARVEAGLEEWDNSQPDPYTTITGMDTGDVVNQRIIIDINKVDNSGAPLSGAIFKVTYSPAAGSHHSAKEITQEVDSNGVLTLDGREFLDAGHQLDSEGDVYGLPNGTYTVTETVVPEGYDNSNPPSFSFTVNNGVLTQAQAANGVTFSSGAGSASFNVVNQLPAGQLGVSKVWLDQNGIPEENHTGTLELRLKQWTEPSKTVSVDVQSYYSNSWHRFGQVRTGTGSGQMSISWTYASHVGDWPTISITTTRGSTFDVNEEMTTVNNTQVKKVTLTSQTLVNNESVTVRINNNGYDPFTGYNGQFVAGTLGNIQWIGSGSGDYEATGNYYPITLSSGDWSQIWYVEGTSYNAGAHRLPATNSGKLAYYSLEELNVPSGYELVSISEEKVHDKAILKATNRKLTGSLKLTKNVTVDGHPLSASDSAEKKALTNGTFTFTIVNTEDANDVHTVTITYNGGEITAAEVDGTAVTPIPQDGYIEVPRLIGATYKITESGRPLSSELTTVTRGDGDSSSVDSDKAVTVTVAQGQNGDAVLSNSSSSAAFTNDFKTTSVRIEKSWEHGTNTNIPASLVVHLSNGMQRTLTSDNGWSATITDLPKYDSSTGELINYTWTEAALPPGYYLSHMGSTTNNETGLVTTTFTNSYTNHYMPETEIIGKKIWEDDGYANRPASITVNLYQGSSTTPYSTITVNAPTGNVEDPDEWPFEFTNLPIFDDNGRIIEYRIEEVLPAGYADTYNINTQFTPGTYVPGTITGDVITSGQGSQTFDVSEGVELGYIVIKHGNNFIIWTPRRPSAAEVEKIRQKAQTLSNDFSDITGISTDKIYYQEEEPHDAHTIQVIWGVPNTVDVGNKHAVSFSMAGDTVRMKFLDPSAWSAFCYGKIPYTYTPAGGTGGGTITNLKKIVDISGTKTWVDGNRTHNNAQQITLALSRTVKPVTDESSWEPVEVEAGVLSWDGNTYTYSGLPRYQNINDTTTEYAYKVEETGVNVTEGTGTDQITIHYKQEDDGNGNFTNTELIDIEAIKTWKNEQESVNDVIKYASVTFKLRSKVGDGDWTDVPEGTGLVNPKTLAVEDTADANAWKAQWSNLPKYALVGEDVVEIQYQVEETEAKLSNISVRSETEPAAAVVNGSANIDNVLPETDFSVTKQWNDGEGNVKVFNEQQTISFTVYQKIGNKEPSIYTAYGTNGKGTVTYTPGTGSESGEWSTVIIDDLPRYVYDETAEAWQEISYNVVEDSITGVSVTYKKGNAAATETPAGAAVNNTDTGSHRAITIINTDVVVPIKIMKVDKNKGTGLSGAKFQLTRKLSGESGFSKFVHSSFEADPENDDKKTGPFTVDSTNGIVLEGLLPGEYRIEEKAAPTGYIITLEPFEFTVGYDGTITCPEAASNELVTILEKYGTVPEGLRIGNTPGASLPSTGGRGTRLFTILGMMLIAGAGLLLLRRRRTI